MTDTLSKRFWSKVRKTKSCWIWTGYRKPHGYGRIWFKKGPEAAHRVIFCLAGKKIPKGMVVDHICRNKSCVRPSHLRIVTIRQNALENNPGTAFQNLHKTHCKRGHELTEDNLVKSLPYRRCLICARSDSRNYMRRIRKELRG